MDRKTLIEVGSIQLDRVLSFFPRVEAKISTLFAVNTAMLAVMGLNANLKDVNVW